MVGSVFTREGENCLGSTDLAATYCSTFLSMRKERREGVFAPVVNDLLKY